MPRILLVDDTPANILVFQELLAREDREILTATNGTEALKIAIDQEIDLIILDVQMPGMDGFEVAQILKSNKRTRDVPIIFASAVKKEQQSIMKGFDEGAVDYLFKPLDPEVTKAKVSVLLKIEAQKKELREKNSSLEKAKAQIDRLNADLMDNVLKLQELNQEMESFSYSVSHDLRAPLRALLGYSEILWEDYNATLNEEGRALIGKIRKGGLRMERLIEDLLVFSKMGRRELSMTEVNMKQLAEKAVEDFPGTKAKISIGPLPPVSGDASLLQQVWANLVSNAIKYSSNKPEPHIDIMATIEGNTVTYSVKDNGAGFDMKYADKLFGVFQRLHGKEFEGTGIGLATAQRILKKHGGKIWAEAKENEGATFFFSLPTHPGG
jgi:two-component system sensor histidine kinase/response regulator